MAELNRKEVDQALTGDEAALTRLVDLLTPVIQARVARLLMRRLAAAGTQQIRQEVEDLTQDVFLLLFADGARVLRGWEPERGLSLKNYVGLVAERRTASTLRTGKRNPWREDLTFSDELDEAAAAEPDPHAAAASREVLELLLRRLQEELSPLGRHLFDLLFLQERSVVEVHRQTSLSRDAIYTWRSRLRRLVHKTFRRIVSETAADREYPSSERRAHG